MTKKFDLTNNPVALYNFEGSAVGHLDLSGNNLHLTTSSPVYRQVWPGVIGLVSGSAARSINDALLSITGDITIEMLLVMRTAPTAGSFPAGFLASGETTATNILYQVAMVNQTLPSWGSESGAGVDANYTPTGANQSLPALGVLFKLDAAS